MPLSEGLRLSPEPELQARRHDLARVTKLMWDIEHGQPVQQDSLDPVPGPSSSCSAPPART